MTPWTAAHQAPPSMGYSRPEYWNGVPLPSLHSPMGTLFLTKEARIHNGAKTASSIVGLGKLDSYMQKNEIRTLPNTIHKDKLKMD